MPRARRLHVRLQVQLQLIDFSVRELCNNVFVELLHHTVHNGFRDSEKIPLDNLLLFRVETKAILLRCVCETEREVEVLEKMLDNTYFNTKL